MNWLVKSNQGNGIYCKILYGITIISISSLSKVPKQDNMVPPGMFRPFLGIGMVANTGILDSITLITAGKNAELNNSILPTSSMIKRSVSSLTWYFNKKYEVNYLFHHNQSTTNFQNFIMHKLTTTHERDPWDFITQNCLPAAQVMLAIPKMLHLLCISQQ